MCDTITSASSRNLCATAGTSSQQSVCCTHQWPVQCSQPPRRDHLRRCWGQLLCLLGNLNRFAWIGPCTGLEGTPRSRCWGRSWLGCQEGIEGGFLSRTDDGCACIREFIKWGIIARAPARLNQLMRACGLQVEAVTCLAAVLPDCMMLICRQHHVAAH